MPSGTIYLDTVTGEMKYLGPSNTTAGIICDTNGSVPLVPCQQSFSLTNGIQSVGGVAGSTFTSKGTRTFDPSVLYAGNSKITRTLQFKALVQVTPGVTMQVRLYNTTDGAAIASSILSSSSSSLVEVSATLALTTDIPNSSKTYDVEIKITSPVTPSNADQAICKSAEIVVRWA
jgi:hypothetical protein